MSPTANDAWHQNGVQGAVEMDLIVAPLGSNLEYRWVSLVNLTMPGFPSESQCWGDLRFPLPLADASAGGGGAAGQRRQKLRNRSPSIRFGARRRTKARSVAEKSIFTVVDVVVSDADGFCFRFPLPLWRQTHFESFEPSFKRVFKSESC